MKKQNSALVVRFGVRRIVSQHSLIDIQRFAACLWIDTRVFLVEAPEIQIGGSEFGRALYGIAEALFSRSIVALLDGDYAAQIVEPGISRIMLGGLGEKAVGLREIAVFDLTLDLEDLLVFFGRGILAGTDLDGNGKAKKTNEDESKIWKKIAHLSNGTRKP